nr:hypothetical protein [Tanacetum cinerariifolium]
MVSSTMDDHVVASVNASDLKSFPTVSEVHEIHSSVNAIKSGGESYLLLPNQGTMSARNTFSKSSYVNVIGESIKSMFNSSTRLFSFHVSSTDGLNSMLENCLWFIRNHPLILRKWNPDVDLLKEDVENVPIWVKLHGVPISSFSEDGLSAIATK